MRVIVVDDEPKAIALLRSYLSHFSDFEVVATFRNGLKALEFMNTNTVDVAFLDINMPHLSGLSLSKMMNPDIAVVFTTAYSEHAVASYDVNALDYLLKPISLERFSKTISKLLDMSGSRHTAPDRNNNRSETVFVKSGLTTHQIRVDAIEYLEKDGNYIHYVVAGKRIMARQSIGEALADLPDFFLQIQRSYIVNFHKIDSISSEYVSIGKRKIPIGDQFKPMLLRRLK